MGCINLRVARAFLFVFLLIMLSFLSVNSLIYYSLYGSDLEGVVRAGFIVEFINDGLVFIVKLIFDGFNHIIAWFFTVFPSILYLLVVLMLI